MNLMKLQIQMAISYFLRNSQEQLEPLSSLVALYHRSFRNANPVSSSKTCWVTGERKRLKNKVIPNLILSWLYSISKLKA